MKRFALFSFALLLLAGCESTDEPKRKAVPPKDDASALPWNRPRSWESSGGMGNMLPQSR